MDCKQFKENHFAFVDDTLPGVELVRMQVHLTECDTCAKHDATVRRSLMLFRSLPAIQPSPDFRRRLDQKLHDARRADIAALQAGRSRRLAATVAVSSVAILGYIAISLRTVDSPAAISLPPVVAIAADADSSPSAIAITSPGPEIVAAVPGGLPIWTAALLTEQAQVRFVSMELTGSTR